MLFEREHRTLPARISAALCRTREPMRTVIADAVRAELATARERTYQVTVRALLGLARDAGAVHLAEALEREVETFVAGECPDLDTAAVPEVQDVQQRWIDGARSRSARRRRSARPAP